MWGGKQKGSLKSSSKIFPDSDSNDEQASGSSKLQFNKNYAEKYDSWRNKEELMKMKARYGSSNLDELEKSSDESSSSEEEEWTPEKEKEFYKALANLKKKDPKIYDPNVKFFSHEQQTQNQESPKSDEQKIGRLEKSKKKKQKTVDKKPFLLKDHERKMILEKGGLLSSDEDVEDEAEKPSTLSYYQQLDDIKKGFNKALEGIESDDDDEDKLLMKRKPISEEDKKQDDEDYRRWLKGELERLDKGKLSKDEEKELGFLRSYWNDDKLDDGEKFLRDYILNRNYIEPKEEQDNDHIPSYNEIVHDSDEGGLSNDEKFEEQREEFEHKYNFRFEEPDQEFIKRFPRTIQDSLRREDERRKKQRDSHKDRKQEAKDRKREEVQRLKAAKRKEIIQQLKEIQEISGDPELAVEDLDIEGDFDPEEYDRRMQKVFNEKYYEEADDGKPEFPFDPVIDDEVNWEEWVPTEDDEEQDNQSPKKAKKKNSKIIQENNVESESESEESEEEEIPASKSKKKQTTIEELIEASKGRNKSKKKSVFLEAIEKKKPKFDPKVHKTFEKYFQEYYALDFEDLVGDLPCRFKYRKVVKNDFGLTTKEILDAEDKELNQWASLKKTYQYRAEDEEKFEAQAYQKKAGNEKLKKRVLQSVYEAKKSEASDDDENNDEEEDVVVPEKPAKAKKVSAKTVHSNTTENPANESTLETPEKTSKRMRKNRNKKNKKNNNNAQNYGESSVTNGDQNQLKVIIKSEVLSPEKSAKKKKNHKNRKRENGTSDTSTLETEPPKNKNFNKVSDNVEKTHKKSGTKRKSEVDNPSLGVEDERLKAYGLNPKKYKKWVKYGGAK